MIFDCDRFCATLLLTGRIFVVIIREIGWLRSFANLGYSLSKGGSLSFCHYLCSEDSSGLAAPMTARMISRTLVASNTAFLAVDFSGQN
jgi:hypothetical protein